MRRPLYSRGKISRYFYGLLWRRKHFSGLLPGIQPRFPGRPVRSHITTASTVQCLKKERKPTRRNNQMFIINFCLNMFRASLCPSSGDQRACYCIWCTAVVLPDVVGSGCGALRCRMRAVLASYNAALQIFRPLIGWLILFFMKVAILTDF